MQCSKFEFSGFASRQDLIGKAHVDQETLMMLLPRLSLAIWSLRLLSPSLKRGYEEAGVVLVGVKSLTLLRRSVIDRNRFVANHG